MSWSCSSRSAEAPESAKSRCWKRCPEMDKHRDRWRDGVWGGGGPLLSEHYLNSRFSAERRGETSSEHKVLDSLNTQVQFLR